MCDPVLAVLQAFVSKNRRVFLFFKPPRSDWRKFDNNVLIIEIDVLMNKRCGNSINAWLFFEKNAFFGREALIHWIALAVVGKSKLISAEVAKDRIQPKERCVQGE
jgi:hypothetical protein